MPSTTVDKPEAETETDSVTVLEQRLTVVAYRDSRLIIDRRRHRLNFDFRGAPL
ncbi:hypothetical protein [Haloquadratum walsbyi]|uniref:hypothetical protein n=1 Tax=Haloquadratum walsbyi TaxID=293091 RepID=UPI000A57FFAD|nr:hypothetical protein [Haloquadratum walsbyi]